jgi:hypothetical protein
MSDPVLQRQIALLEHLTGSRAIFGDDDLSRPWLGMDRGLLHLEARFSHEKRMAKIRAVLPRTLDHLGSAQKAILRDFAAAHPPTGIGRMDNARQFRDFLLARWRQEAPLPPYLPDLAAFEIAYAAVQRIPGETPRAAPDAHPGAIRRHPAVVLLRTDYDIRPILEHENPETAAQPGEVCLALTMPAGDKEPVVQALLPELFALLGLIEEFTPRETFADLPHADAMIEDFAAAGLIQVHP